MQETILLAEDDELLAELILQILRSAGYEVLYACNGLEMVDRYYNNRSSIRLVLADIQMPLLDGLTGIQIIRHANPFLPILVTSAFADENMCDEITGDGYRSVVSKPFTPACVINAVHLALTSSIQDPL